MVKKIKEIKDSRRARVDLPVDRNEFIRLQQAVNEDLTGGSGTSGVNLKKKSEDKTLKPKFPKMKTLLPEVVVDSPVSEADKPKKKKKSRRSAPQASLFNSEPALSSVPHDEAAAVGAADESREADDAQILVVDADGELTFAEPAPVVAAEVERLQDNGRGLVVSRVLPIAPEHREAFRAEVLAMELKDFYREAVVSSKIRRLVLRNLRQHFDCGKIAADRLLQVSKRIYEKFVPDFYPVEHYAIAYAIGQLRFEGTDYDSDQWVHCDVPDASDDERDSDSIKEESDEEQDAPSAVPAEVSSRSHLGRKLFLSAVNPVPSGDYAEFEKFVNELSLSELHLKDIRSSPARLQVLKDLREMFNCSSLNAERLLQASYLVYTRFISGDRGEAAEHNGIAIAIGVIVSPRLAALALTEPHSCKVSTSSKASLGSVLPSSTKKIRVPVVDQLGTATTDAAKALSHAETLARELNMQFGGSPDRTNPISDAGLDRAIETIRRTLPASLAEGVVNGLLRANDQLRSATPNPKTPKVKVVPETPLSEAAVLGRGYRIGDLAREQRAFDHHVNVVGARVASRDAPESSAFLSDRPACLDPTDQAILGTLRKVLAGGAEYAHLNSKQKLRALGRAVRRRIDDAHAEGRDPVTGKKKKAAGDDGNGGDGSSSDDSFGESCNDSDDSRDSAESYERDDFCVGDDDSQSDGSGGGGSEEDDQSDGEKRQLKARENSANSLGTPPTKLKISKPVAADPSAPATREAPSLVLLGDEDLPLWKSGAARFKQGFHWDSYLHHKQQYDNYKAHRGRYSDRTFKSIIDTKFVPAVCASCGFRRSSWADIPDYRLILRIERVLRPSKSTDFAMELKAIKMEKFGDEPLQSTYSSFAEKFICKVAEAADAGRPINSVVIKAAFKKAVDGEVPLKTWLEGVKWRGVDQAHQRLLRKLREARSWEAMTKSVHKSRSQRVQDDDERDAVDGRNGGRRTFKPRARGKINAGRGARSRLKGRSNSTARKRRINSTGAAHQGKPKRDSGGGNRPRAEKLRTFKGYDNRGESWHTDQKLFDCYKKPCHAPFCNRCASHGHTADYCRVPDGTEGLNHSGYFEEQRPGKAGPKRPPARSNSSRRKGGNADSGDSGDDESDRSSERYDDDRDDGDSHQGHARSRRSNSTRGRKGRACL